MNVASSLQVIKDWKITSSTAPFCLADAMKEFPPTAPPMLINCAQNETPRPNISRRGALPPIFHFFTALDRLGMGPTAQVTEYEDEQGYTPARSGSFCWIIVPPRRLAIFDLHCGMLICLRTCGYMNKVVSPATVRWAQSSVIAWNLITYIWWYTCSLRGYVQSQPSYMDYGLYKYKIAELASDNWVRIAKFDRPITWG